MNSVFRTIAYTLVCLGTAKCFEMEQLMNPSPYMHIAEAKNDTVARIDGDLILGGLFSLHPRRLNDQCASRTTNRRNIVRVEAMLYAVEEVGIHNLQSHSTLDIAYMDIKSLIDVFQ